jgi:hypothetical protein
MNAEKELLLTLLIEKYATPKSVTSVSIVNKPRKAKRSRVYSLDHKWTDFEKQKLVYLKDQGMTWPEIAERLGLRDGQVKSALSNLAPDELDRLRSRIQETI